MAEVSEAAVTDISFASCKSCDVQVTNPSILSMNNGLH